MRQVIKTIAQRKRETAKARTNKKREKQKGVSKRTGASKAQMKGVGRRRRKRR